MKRPIALIVAAALLLCCAACSDGGVSQALTFPLSSSPKTLDPQYCSGTAADIIINNCFEGLTREGENGKIIPGVAESWSVSPSGLEYTFTLRADTKWSRINAFKNVLGEDKFDAFKEKPVTANDFVFAFRRAVSPSTNSPSAALFSVIKNAPAIMSGKLGSSSLGVSATNARTLVITLENPCDDLLERLAMSAFMPCNEDFFNATGGRYGLAAKYILCNGPFYVKLWDSETKLVAFRSEGYVGEYEVLPSGVTFAFDNDPAAIAEKLGNGAYSAAILTPYYLPDSGSVTLVPIDDTVFGLCFNCADEYLSNENLRLALCLSIDREGFGMLEGMSDYCDGLVPSCCAVGSLNYRDAVGKNTRSLTRDTALAGEKWQAGLTELGVSRVSITILCSENHDDALRRQLQIWQKLFGISIAVNLEDLTEAEIVARMKSGDYQLALGPVSSPSQTAAGFLSCFKQGSADNFFNYSSSQYDLVAEKILSVDSQSEMLNGCFTAESMLLQSGVCLPMYERPSYFAMASGVSQLICSSSGDNVCFIRGIKLD